MKNQCDLLCPLYFFRMSEQHTHTHTTTTTTTTDRLHSSCPLLAETVTGGWRVLTCEECI